MLLKNLKIVTPTGVIENGRISIENGKIQQIISEQDYRNPKKAASYEDFSECEDILKEEDMTGLTAFPGFIDIHLHGSNGYDTMDTIKYGVEVLEKMAQGLIKSGVTSFLATTVSAEAEKLKIVEQVVEKAREHFFEVISESPTAEVLGLHLEGPFINPLAKGAQNGEYIRKPELEVLDYIGKTVKIITLAPEEDYDFQFIKKAVELGIVVSAGHSKGSYEEMKKAFDAGVSGVTHLFNGMTPLHHREPGLAGAGLDDTRVYVEIIADRIHLHPAILRLVKRVKGSQKVMLVTDAMEGQGMEPGEYELGGLKVFVDKDSARLQDGTLAGSILTMDKALQIMKTETEAKLEELAEMTSGNQARLLGLTDRGAIEAGKLADLVFLDENLMVKKVMKRGMFLSFDL